MACVARIVAVASAAAFMAGSAASGSGAAAPACARSVSSVPLGLPAPVRITTTCAIYTVFPSGRIRVGARPLRVDAGITAMLVAGPGATVVQRGARIAVLRGGRAVFRSRGHFRAAGVFALIGPRAVASGYENYEPRAAEALYVAPLHGDEREIARGERPLGWMRSGTLLTTCASGVCLRDSTGALLRRLRTRVREVRFEPARSSLLALSHSGVLERYDEHWHRLRDLRTLGFGDQVSFEPLAGGLIGVLEGRHVAVLRADGSLFASAWFRPRRGAFSVAGESGLVANAAASAVAFAVTIGDNGGGRGRESLYVLHAGDRRASKLYGAAMKFVICERWASVAWHRNWLLYATPEGRTLVLDTRGGAGRIDLSGLIHRLAGRDAEGKMTAQVSWS